MIPLSISTRWNAGRHRDGAAMLEEILDLGLGIAELGYDLRAELIPGVKAMVAARAIRIDSVHNFCPVPVGAPRPHPELYTPASPDRREREYAVTHISRTLRFAAEVGARVVVCHSGNVDMPKYSFDLVRMPRAASSSASPTKTSSSRPRSPATRRRPSRSSILPKASKS